jgi:PAS domain S-box-containing protein
MTADDDPGDPTRDPAFFRLLAERSLDVITVLDAGGHIVYQSPSVERVLGHDPATMLGRPVAEFVHPEDQARTLEAIGRVLGGEREDETVELRFRHGDGRWRHIEASGLALEFAGRLHVLVNTRDVTDRHEAVRALAHTNELLTKSFASSRNIVSITHAGSGEFAEVNDEWVRVSGYAREEAIGRTAMELGIWGTVENRQRVLDAVAAGDGRLRDFEVTTYGRNGPVQLVVNVETLRVGDAPMILMTGTDVTETRITEEKLRQAQKMEAVGQLTGGVAHDFNNLLGIVMGNAELLAELVAGQPELEECVTPILQASQRGATLTQQLLAFSRRQMLAPRNVDLVRTLEQLQPLLRTTLGPAVRLTLDTPAGLWPCRVDPAQLENAVLNLVLNARDALEGAGEVRLSLAPRRITTPPRNPDLDAPPGDYAALTVADDGQGMDRETLEKACEPFFTTKEPGRGTGLGLSMVFGFVRQSGGQVELESTPGEGTRVTMLLPRAAAETGTAAPGEASTVPRARGETVLVVEDEPELLRLLRGMLEELGYRVLQAADEGGVLALLAEGAAFDLVVSDVLLAGPRRGPELVRALREARPGTPAVYISGYPEELDAEALPGASVPLLAKPFSREALARRVRAALDGEPA